MPDETHAFEWRLINGSSDALKAAGIHQHQFTTVINNRHYGWRWTDYCLLVPTPCCCSSTGRTRPPSVWWELTLVWSKTRTGSVDSRCGQWESVTDSATSPRMACEVGRSK
jgi:hypothetical protein